MFFGIIPLILFIIFLISYLKDPRKIINGFLFNAFFCSFLLFCAIASFASGSNTLHFIVILPMLALLFMIPFGIVALMFGLFLNARILMRREGRRFTNSLTLIAALGILFCILIPIINPASLFSEHFQFIFAAISLVTMYFFIHLSNFLSAYFLYQFNRPRRNQDFIIVLGSGLINDKVPPLLASRCEYTTNNHFLWGQGPDKGLPEAEAMQNYAVEKGIPLEHTVQENRSVNTYQNMSFSKEIMDSLKPEGKYKSIFTTNNFHLFRAGIYARQAGLNSQGIGSKTAFYYWPNAMIREYVAIVVMGRKRHMKICGTILGFALFLTVVSFILS